MAIKKFSSAGLYMTGLISLDQQKIEKEIEAIVEIIDDRRDYDSMDMFIQHKRLKELTTEFVRLTNEIETLQRLPY